MLIFWTSSRGSVLLHWVCLLLLIEMFPVVCVMLLRFLGVMDIIRGILHSFLINHSAVNIAKMNLTHNKDDQLMLLTSFGISNYLTGFLFLLIAFKAEDLAPCVLALIPISYGLGFLSIKINGIKPKAKFVGRYVLLVYNLLCVIASVGFYMGY